MLRICIPVHNEATTIGVLLWRLRTVFQGFSREYDVVIYDDASTDGTDEVLEPYQSVMPLTVVRGGAHRGYAGSIDALVRHVAADDEYARRDAMVLLQGDFTESPEHLPELVKRFEGGADLVAVHRTMSDATPADERRLRRWGRWAVSPFLRLPPVADPFTGFRLVRISVLRELLRALGSRPVCAGDGWAANIDFALNVSPFARRIENVEFAPRYDVRQRASRRRGWPDVIALFHWARGARRSVRPSPGGKPAEASGRAPADATPISTPIERSTRAAAPTDRSAERGGGQPERSARPPREQRPPRADRPERLERPERQERPERPERPPREERVVAAVMPDEPTPAVERSTVVSESVVAPRSEPSGGVTDAAGGEPRSRRRRRRSRRGREAKNEDGTLAVAPPDGSTGSAYAADDDSGTSDDGEGEVAGGSDDSTMVESDSAGAETSGDVTRRKRRSRRRRRGRRPGGPDAADSDSASPPPAAEPPAA